MSLKEVNGLLCEMVSCSSEPLHFCLVLIPVLYRMLQSLQIVEKTKLKCRCHGVTASCSVLFCWNEVQHFTAIGNELKKKYNNAVRMRLVIEPTGPVAGHQNTDTGNSTEVTPVFTSEKRNLGMRKNVKWYLTPADANTKYPAEDELIYIDESPDYCSENSEMGIMGTTGRQCHDEEDGSEGSCKRMCCGRGHRTVTRTIRTSCHCKFVYCCRVECQTCEHTVTEHFCN